ncbi:MAG: LON peptidase substrate-binding domain-containing protein [Thermomicrobiales bacterium]|nr:LON peptidase substrate-binding domain-containing protein [Thermomicrobiales bacterium]
MTDRLPLFPLGVVLFPSMLLPLHIFEDRYRRLMRDRQNASPMFGVVLTKRGNAVGDRPEIHRVGCAAEMIGAGRYPDGRYDLIVRGGRRFQVRSEEWSAGYLTGEVDWLAEPLGSTSESTELDSLTDDALRVYDQFLGAFERMAETEVPREELPEDPIELAYALCARAPLDAWELQRLLEWPTARDRLLDIRRLLRRERDLLTTTGIGGATLTRPGISFTAN